MLPTDIVLMITALCDPPTIISLCMTCKQLYSDIFDSRLVWLRCLRILVTEQCLAPYSLYPNSMPTEGLREHACRPHLLKASLLRNPDDFRLDCEEIHLVYEHIEHERSPLTPFRFDPVLLPGGRWLLDCAIDLNSAIFAMCWDLWSSDTDGCYPVAVFPSQLDNIISWVQQASDDANKATILINGTDTHDDWGCEILRLVWPSEHDSPRFEYVAVLFLNAPNSDPGRGPRGYLSGKYVIVPHESQCLVLWDWVSDSWTRIQLDGVNESEMYKIDAWVQEPFIFFIRADGDALVQYRIPVLTPLGTGQEDTQPLHALSGSMWKLPELPDIETSSAPFPYILSHHSTSHPGSWRAPSNDSCITTVSLHMPMVYGSPHTDHGGMFIIDTRPDENGEVTQPRILPLPIEDLILDSSKSVGAQLDLHHSSRAHLVGDLLTSIGIAARLDDRTRTIYMDIRSYPLSETGHLLQWPIESQVPTMIPWEKRKRMKLTNAPCSVTGTFLASEKGMTKAVWGVTRYTTRIWLLRFH